jgi:hypothetical protein
VSYINREKLVEILAGKPLEAQVDQLLEFILNLEANSYNKGFEDGWRQKGEALHNGESWFD